MPSAPIYLLVLLSSILIYQVYFTSTPSSATSEVRKHEGSHYNSNAPSDAPVVATRNGSYYGLYNQHLNQDIFFGIPYAQPPIGQLRFAVPQGVNSTWPGLRNATEVGSSCVAYGGDTRMGVKSHTSEDCLSLVVVRPAAPRLPSLPVMVWIHGGGFVDGSSAVGWYNTSFLVKRSVELESPILAVGINYRLAAWGFSFSDDFAREGATNLGLRDQRLALHWIQENIAAFGGDPNKVTIFGQSAGSMSVAHQMFAYNGRDDGLFHGAIAQSGSPLHLGPYSITAERISLATETITNTVCPNATDSLACLRNADFEDLNNAIVATLAQPVVGPLYGPVVDGDIFAQPVLQQLQQGRIVTVPFILGTTNDEVSLAIPKGLNTEADLQRSMTSFMGLKQTQVDAILPHYPYDDPESVVQGVATHQLNTTIGLQFKRASTIATDVIQKGPVRYAGQLYEKINSGSTSPLYMYNANTTISKGGLWCGAGHGFDLPYMFYNLDGIGWEGDVPPFFGGNPFDGRPQSYLDLAKVMSGMWVGFANNGVPSYKDQPVPVWPPYQGVDGQVMNFDAQPEYLNVRLAKEARTERQDFVNQIVYG